LVAGGRLVGLGVGIVNLTAGLTATPLLGVGVSAWHLLVLVGFTAGFAAVSVVSFERRDLAV